MDNHTLDIARVEAKVDSLALKVDGLLDAWNTARGLVRFVKLLGQISLAIGAVWGLLQLGNHK